MSKYKDMAKEKWAEKKPQHNIRGSAKGKVNGLIGRNKESNDAPTHEAAPLASLRDPNSFAPPPRRTGTGLTPAPPPSTAKRKVITAPSKYQDPRGPAITPPAKVSADPLVAQYQEEHGGGHDNGQQLLLTDGSEGGQAASSQPYRKDTTGLRTDHLPPPPGRRDGADGRAPPSYDAANTSAAKAIKPPGPSLPPRLPPRTGSGSSASSHGATANQDTVGSGLLNQSSVRRLGAAGVSVPGLRIGSSPSPGHTSSPAPPPPPRNGSGGTTPTTHTSSASAQVNELQNRFSHLKTPSSSSSPAAQSPSSPGGGTTWQQKQAALKTASAFHKDPSSVSLSDAKSAASTANNFHQRHGDQIAAGMHSASNLNQKYGIANRLSGTQLGGNSAQAQQPPSQQQPAQGVGGGGASALAAVAAKKKPPPPPVKKPGLGTAVIHSAGNDEPPPIPMSTRPAF